MIPEGGLIGNRFLEGREHVIRHAARNLPHPLPHDMSESPNILKNVQKWSQMTPGSIPKPREFRDDQKHPTSCQI